MEARHCRSGTWCKLHDCQCPCEGCLPHSDPDRSELHGLRAAVARLNAERDSAKHATGADLVHIGALCGMTDDEYPLKVVQRVVKERDEARELLGAMIDMHAHRMAPAARPHRGVSWEERLSERICDLCGCSGGDMMPESNEHRLYMDCATALRTRLATAERELAEARRAVDNIGDAYDRLVSAVVGGVASAAYCFDTSEYEKEAERLRATIDASDTTRREWEVRAATSYRGGRAAGLRELVEAVPPAEPHEHGDHGGAFAAECGFGGLCGRCHARIDLADAITPDVLAAVEAVVALGEARVGQTAVRMNWRDGTEGHRERVAADQRAADARDDLFRLADRLAARKGEE